MSNNGHKFESAIISSTLNFECGICSSSRWHAAFSCFCKATQGGPRIKVVDNCLVKSIQKVASSLAWFGPSILGFANHRQYVLNFESGICSSSRWHAAFSCFCIATQVGPRIKVVDNCLVKNI